MSKQTVAQVVVDPRVFSISRLISRIRTSQSLRKRQGWSGLADAVMK
ncbi:MAG TPA: hypothetical protein VE931_11905 [Pyrinomonadaceae bacterium]|nr:hypothetical protein [Pyrinomonadaceae bacterium]